MALVGEAHVIVRAVTDKVRGDIQRGFQGQDRIAGAAGRNAGAEYQRGFRRGMGGRGTLFSKSFEAEAERARQSLQSLIAVGNVLGPALAGLAGGIGAAGAGLFSLGAAAAGAIPSLVVLPGLLLAAAQAAFTLKLAFGGIGAALSAGLRGGSGGGGGGGGIGRQAIDNAKQIEAAQERVADARRRLTEVLRDNVERRQEAIDRAQRAQEDALDAQKSAIRADRDYADSQNDTRKAVEALAKAREEAVEDLQQLRFETEAANLGEKRARLEFEKSRDALQRLQDLPPNSRARQEAELAFAEADLNLRRAIDKNQDLRKEEKRATAAGVEGSDKVISAQESLLQARRAEQDALEAKTRAWRDSNRALQEAAKAQREVGEVERENAQRTQDAIKDLRDAYDDLNDARKQAFTPGAGGGGGGGLDPFAEAMSKLSKEAQDFVRYLINIKPEFDKLRESAGKLLFPKLQTAIQTLVDKLFPVLNPLLEKTGGVIGDVAIKIAETITQGRNLPSLERIWETGDYLITAFGDAVSNLITVFLRVMEAAGPLIKRFADWVVGLTEAWKVTAQGSSFVEDLEKSFNRAGNTAAQIGRIFKETFGGLSQLFKAATGPGSGGQFLLDFFEKGAVKFREFATIGNRDGSLKKYFLDASVNASKVLQLIGDIAKIFLKLGGTQGTGGFIDGLRKAVPYIQQIADNLAAAGPKLGDLVAKIAEFIAAITSSGAIQFFYDTLLLVADAMIAIVNNPFAKWILSAAGVLLGIGSAVGILTKLFKFLYMAMIGNIVNVIRNFANLKTAITGTGAAATTTNTQINTLKITTSTLGTTMQATTIQTTAQATAQRGLGVAAVGAAGGIRAAGTALKVAFISNPVGLAITALTTVLGFFIMAQMDASAAVDDLTASLDAQTGAATRDTYEKLNEQVTEAIGGQERWAEVTRITGVEQGEFVRALVEGGSALDIVKQKLAEAGQETMTYGRHGAIVHPTVTALTNAIRNEGGALEEARQAAANKLAGQQALDAALNQGSATFDRTAGRVARFAREQRLAAEDAARLEGQIKGLKDAFDDLRDLLNKDNSSINYRNSLRDLEGALDKNKKALFGNEDMYSKVSIAADKNRQVVNAAVSDMLQNVEDLGGSPKEVEANFTQGVEDIRKALKKAGFKPEDIKAYLKEFNLVGPESKKLLQKMIDAGNAAVDEMRQEGVNAGQGYVNGVLSQKDESYNAGYALGLESARGTRDAQDSRSPSKVFQKIGEEAVDGYLKGLGGFDKAVKLFSKAIDSIVKGSDDKVKEWGEKTKTRFEKFVGDLKQLADVMKNFKKELQDVLNPPGSERNQELLESNPLLYAQTQIASTGTKLDELSAKLGKSKANTDGLIAEFSTLADTLKAELTVALDQAKANLDELKQRAEGWRQSVQSAFQNFSLADALGTTGEEGGKSFTDRLNEQAAQANAFAAKVKELIEKGFSQETIQQVLAAGATTGTKIADELLAGGAATLEADKSLQAANQLLIDNLYQAGYQAWYAEGIAKAEKNVEGVEDAIKAQFGPDSKLNKVMKRLANKLAKDVVLDVKLSANKFDVTIDVRKVITEVFQGGGDTRVRGATGGIVRRPTVALIGEAGPEAVIPLNRTPGNSPLPDSFGNNIEINVYPSPGMNENELAEMVSRKLAFQMRRGTI